MKNGGTLMNVARAIETCVGEKFHAGAFLPLEKEPRAETSERRERSSSEKHSSQAEEMKK